MPEAPEVSYIVSKLKKLENSNLKSIDILKGRYKKHGPPKNFNTFT